MNGKQKNPHPTLKPIALAKYLATLLLPPDEYAPRRILIPFSGVGSEMVGAALAGWEHIVGIEFDTENDYVEIAKKRIEYWTNK
jgi:DNA modification methylase